MKPMDSIQVQGGTGLQGKVRIQGSKNAALPVLAATILTGDESYIGNCPRIADVFHMESLLKSLGCRVSWENHGLRIHSAGVCAKDMPADAIKGMRSSLFLLGALIGRCGRVAMDYPGGCVIGARPIDMHLEALKQMGVFFLQDAKGVYAVTEGLHGARICLSFPSVGVTENVVMCAVKADGETLLEGAAREPEVCALCNYLKACGADIEGIGTSILRIQGGKPLHGASFEIEGDRIVAGTYLLACTATGGACFLEGAPAAQMEAVIHVAEQLGAWCDISQEGIFVQSLGVRTGLQRLRTAPYPGFPTDLQSVALAVLTAGEGNCLIEEQIFENRFRIVKDLRSMGAEVEMLDEHRVLVHGGKKLRGSLVEAAELRGGAALVVAGLMAEGSTLIEGRKYIDRGYENICRDLRELGARIVSV